MRSAAFLGVAGLSAGLASAEESLLRRFFNLVDEDKDGFLAAEELSAYFEFTGLSECRANDEKPSKLLPAQLQLSHDGVKTHNVSWADFFERFQRLDGDPESRSPEQIHLAPTGNPTEMRVTFITLGDTTPPPPGQEALVHVRSPDGSERTFEATSENYKVPHKWWQPNGWTGLVHTAVVTGLEHGKTYEYQVEAFGKTSAPSTFKSAPSSSDPLVFATFGDMGTIIPMGFWVTDKLIKEQKIRPLDMIFHQGDIAYAGVDGAVPPLGIKSNDEMEFVWDAFGRQMAPISSQIPYVTGVGNHEAWYNWTAFVSRYPMPSSSPNSFPPFWFSFDYGPVHFTSISSEHDYSPGSAQRAWVEADLRAAAANRGNVPWIALAVHRPLLCSDDSETGDHVPGAPLISAFEPLMIQYGVDITFAGHQHWYERVHPVIGSKVVSRPDSTGAYVNPGAPVHLTIGSAGAALDNKGVDPTPEWSAVRFGGPKVVGGFGYVRIEVNATHLHGEFVEADDEPKHQDHFWIVKDRPATVQLAV